MAITVDCHRLTAAPANAAAFLSGYPTYLGVSGSSFGSPTSSGGSNYLPDFSGSYSSASGFPSDAGPPL